LAEISAADLIYKIGSQFIAHRKVHVKAGKEDTRLFDFDMHFFLWYEFVYPLSRSIFSNFQPKRKKPPVRKNQTGLPMIEEEMRRLPRKG
jgi:hypothetical protein